MSNLEKQFASVKASVEMEGFVVTEEMKNLLIQKHQGKLTNEEWVEAAKKIGKKHD